MKQLMMIVALMFAAGFVFAGEEEEAVTVPTFEELDANQDGLVSQEEAMGSDQVAANFSAADIDQDGYLTQQEYQELVSRTG